MGRLASSVPRAGDVISGKRRVYTLSPQDRRRRKAQTLLVPAAGAAADGVRQALAQSSGVTLDLLLLLLLLLSDLLDLPLLLDDA